VTLLGGAQEGSRQGRFWAYIGEEYPYSVYDFTESRARDGPANFLQGFQGYLHTDAYGGYDHIFLGSNDSIREVACWAHAAKVLRSHPQFAPRRPPALGMDPATVRHRGSSAHMDRGGASRASSARGGAYARSDRDLPAPLARRALPKTVLAKAASYAQNQWQALRRYTTDGRLSIDNNVSERTLRHQAIGRKNWLFLGSRQAGPRAAVLFTILAGAKRHRIEPWTYLRELLLRLHDDDSRFDQMLPDKWAAHHPESVLTYRLEESRRKAAAKSSRRRHARATPPTC
jgi:transposase